MITLRFREQLDPIVADELDSIVAALQALQAANELFTTPTTIPPGLISPFAGTSAPDGYLMCDGSPVSRFTYASLYDVIGTLYGSGDGATTFNVPDLRGKFPLCKSASGTGSVLAGTGGSLDHTHSYSISAHTHSLGSHSHSISSSGSHTHSTPNHTHGFSTSTDGAHTHTVTVPGASQFASGALVATYPTILNTSSNGSHSHTGTTDSDGSGNTGSGGSHDHGGSTGSTVSGNTGSGGSASGNTGSASTPPPFMALNYVIKT